MSEEKTEQLTEHTAGKSEPLDTPFPYTGITPSSSAPIGSKENALDFLLRNTGCKDAENLEKHASDLQRRAYQTWPYPCIRRWSFLTMKSAEHPAYAKVLDVGKEKDAIFLELGCFFGTDSRKLVDDGWSAKQVIGTDLRSEWFEKGYELYNDNSTCPIRFVAGDIFDTSFLPLPSSSTQPSSAALADVSNLGALTGRVRAMSAFSFFHLFEEEGQYQLATRLAPLLSPKKGSVLYGSHQGGLEKKTIPRHNKTGEFRFVHSPESWNEMWESKIFPASRDPSIEGTKVKATCNIMAPREREGRPADPNSSRTMAWSVEVI